MYPLAVHDYAARLAPVDVPHGIQNSWNVHHEKLNADNLTSKFQRVVAEFQGKFWLQ